MANIDTQHAEIALDQVRRKARQLGHVQRAQMMVLAAGLAAFGIVAVAAAMMSTLL